MARKGAWGGERGEGEGGGGGVLKLFQIFC